MQRQVLVSLRMSSERSSRLVRLAPVERRNRSTQTLCVLQPQPMQLLQSPCSSPATSGQVRQGRRVQSAWQA